MDLNTLKGRIAEAFVEKIFHDAGYTVCRSGRESQVHRLFMTGEAEFLPDFIVWKRAEVPPDGGALHRLLSVEVKFRSKLQAFLRPRTVDPILASAVRWPDLHLVLVTDSPAPARSCFQLLELPGASSDIPLAPIDLHEFQVLGIHKTITDRYEQLLRQVFAPLRQTIQVRKPPVKLPNNTSRSRRASSAPGILG